MGVVAKLEFHRMSKYGLDGGSASFEVVFEFDEVFYEIRVDGLYFLLVRFHSFYKHT